MMHSDAVLMSTTPSGSRRRRPDDLDSGTNRRAPSRPTTPSGTLIRKIIRQPVPRRAAVTSQPARIGPGDRGHPHDGAERGERAGHLLGREDLLDHAEPLRDEQRAEAAL